MGNRGFPPALTCTSSFTRLAAGRSTRCPGSPSTASPSNLPALTRTGPTPEPAAVTGREAPASDRRDASHSSPTQPGLDSLSRQGRPGHRGGSPCSSYMGAASVPPTRSRCRNPRLVGYFRNLPSPAPADEAGNRGPCKSQHRENQQGRIPHARIRRQTSMKGNGCRQQFVRAQATE